MSSIEDRVKERIRVLTVARDDLTKQVEMFNIAIGELQSILTPPPAEQNPAVVEVTDELKVGAKLPETSA